MAASSSLSDPLRHALSNRRPLAEEEFGLRERRPDRPIARARRLHRRRLCLRWGLAAATVAVVATFWTVRRGTETDAPAPAPSASLVAPPPEWQPLQSAEPFYAVEGADGLPAAALLQVRIHARSGREDALTFGTFGQAGYAHLAVLHGSSEPDAARFYVDLVRRAARLGLSVLRTGTSQALASKFGTVEAASVTFGANAEQTCLAFRSAQDQPGFGLYGWLCGSDALPVTTDQLVCFLDRVVLTRGAADPTLKALFAQADRRRLPECAPVPAPAPARAGPAKRR
jgi:hypothetical protein